MSQNPDPTPATAPSAGTTGAPAAAGASAGAVAAGAPEGALTLPLVFEEPRGARSRRATSPT